MKSLAAKILAYKEALDALPSEKTDDYESDIRRILLARDAVAKALNNVTRIGEEDYGRVVKEDKRLKDAAQTVVYTIGADAFVNWREANQPPDSAWWWFLDRRVAQDEARDEEAKQKRGALWIILTVLCGSVSLNLTAEIVKRFFSGGKDALSIVNTFFQTLLIVLNAGLGVLALGTLTDPGRQWAEGLLTNLGLFKTYGAKKRFLVAAVVLVSVLCFRLSLPAIARFYMERGARFAGQGDQAGEMDSFRRAVSLDPDNAGAHYALGTAYENLRDHNDEAINEYSSATLLDSRFLEARNNLARLYIKRGRDEKDFENALQIINDALRLSPSEWDIRYTLYKNRGWAECELKLYPRAEDDLRTAIQIDESRPGRNDASEDRAAAHCLLGYALEAEQKEGAIDEWDFCARYYSCGDEDLDPKFVRTARERSGIEGDCP
jgi:tetratricopeptide (TPR) repeat protein